MSTDTPIVTDRVGTGRLRVQWLLSQEEINQLKHTQADNYLNIDQFEDVRYLESGDWLTETQSLMLVLMIQFRYHETNVRFKICCEVRPP